MQDYDARRLTFANEMTNVLSQRLLWCSEEIATHFDIPKEQAEAAVLRNDSYSTLKGLFKGENTDSRSVFVVFLKPNINQATRVLPELSSDENCQTQETCRTSDRIVFQEYFSNGPDCKPSAVRSCQNDVNSSEIQTNSSPVLQKEEFFQGSKKHLRPDDFCGIGVFLKEE